MSESLFTESAQNEQAEVEYRDIPGFPGYRAGSNGTLWSCWHAKGMGYGRAAKQVMTDKWKQLRGDPRPEDGRLRYTLKHESGRYVRKYGSNFVLLAYCGERPESMEACHNDGNCLNDSADNLRWDSSVANKEDMKLHGTRPSGESHPSAKLSDHDIAGIIAMRTSGAIMPVIAKQYGVTTARVHQIIKKGGR